MSNFLGSLQWSNSLFIFIHRLLRKTRFLRNTSICSSTNLQISTISNKKSKRHRYYLPSFSLRVFLLILHIKYFVCIWANTNPIKDEYKTVPQLVVMVCLGLILNIERAKNNKTKFFKNVIKTVVTKESTPSFVDHLVKSFLSCI